MKLGTLLECYMKTRGLSLREVGKEMGINHTTVRRIIQGEPVGGEIIHKFYLWLLQPDK